MQKGKEMKSIQVRCPNCEADITVNMMEDTDPITDELLANKELRELWKEKLLDNIRRIDEAMDSEYE